MQTSTWGNRQRRPVGQQLQPNKSSHLLNTATHFTQQVSTHSTMSMLRNNLCLPANNGLQTNIRQDYHSNSAQTLSKQTHSPTVNFNTTYGQQVMPAQPVSGKPSVIVHYQQQHGTIQSASNQNTNPQAKNIQANPTSSPSVQAVYNNTQLQPVTLLYNQVAAQGQSCSQSSQEATGPSLQNNFRNHVNTNVPFTQNVQVYRVNSVTVSGVSTSSLNTRNQCEQNSNVVPWTNKVYPIHPINGHESVLCQMLTTNSTDNTSNSLTAGPVQTNSNSHHNQEHFQHLTARGNRDMQIVPNYATQSVILSANRSCTLNAPNPLVLIPVQSLPDSAYGKSSLESNRAAPPQTTLSTMGHSVNGPATNLKSCFYERMNKISNGNPCASMTQPSQVIRCEVFNKFDTVSGVHPNNGSLNTSPGRALRAIAVVPPLSQDSCHNNHASSNSQPSEKTAPDSFFTGPNQKDIPSVPTQDTVDLKEASQYFIVSRNVFTEKADSVEGKKDQCFAQVANPLVNLKLSVRLSATPKRKTPTEQNPSEKELLALPTAEWTLEKLHKKIIEMENIAKQHKSDDANYNIPKQLIDRFWDSDFKRLISNLRNGWYTGLMNKMGEFFKEHVKENTVILSHMTSQSSLPTRYHVLQHDEVGQDTFVHTSSWLNKNSQLDDIDKEFGFPWFLKYHQECGSDSHAASPGRRMDAETPSDVNESQSELQPVHSEPEKPMTDEDTLKQPASPNDLNAQPCEPSYSFKIEVLSPDVAKVIFDQIQCKSPQKVDNSLTEKETTSSESDDKPDDTKERCLVSTVEKGLSPDVANVMFKQIQCKSPQKVDEKETTGSENDDKPDDTERCLFTTVEKVCCIEKWKEKVFGLSSESKCKCEEQTEEENPFIEGEEKQTQSQHKNDSDEKPKYLWPTTASTVELTKEDKTPVIALKEIGDTNTDIIVISESEDEVLNHTDHHEEDFEQVCHTNSVASIPSTPFTPSGELKDKTETNLKADSENLLLPLPLKNQKLPAHLKSQTILESFSKCRNVAAGKTVELVLFGSTQENSAAASRRSHLLCPEPLLDKSPPRKISVKMNPLKRSSETEPLCDISVKRRIHENWRNGVPPFKIKLKGKNKKFSVLNVSHAKTFSPTKNKNLEVSSKRKFTDASDSQLHRKKRRRGVKRTDKLVNGQVLRKPEVPLQENVLKFNVLPTTFNFKEVSHNATGSDASADKTAVEVVDKQHITKTKGTWCEKPSKKYSPLHPASGPESNSLFQEFQKRYKMMTRTDKNE